MMKAPTAEQVAWAAQAFEYTREFFREVADCEHADFTPMLTLLDHLRAESSFGYLSVFKSLYWLSIASAAHVDRPFSLIPGAPSIGILQLPAEFEFRSCDGKKRRCSFDDATEVLDNKLVALSIMCENFDARKRGDGTA